VVVGHVEDAVVAMVRADVVDLVRRETLAAHQALEVPDVRGGAHGRYPARHRPATRSSGRAGAGGGRSVVARFALDIRTEKIAAR
jgi:hypothetical protein